MPCCISASVIAVYIHLQLALFNEDVGEHNIYDTKGQKRLMKAKRIFFYVIFSSLPCIAAVKLHEIIISVAVTVTACPTHAVKRKGNPLIYLVSFSV